MHDRTWNEYRKTYGHQPKGQKNGFHDDSSKYTETQPYRAALYLRKKLVIYFHKNSRDELIKGMEHYCDPNDYNKTFYYSNDSDTENHLAAILKDADRLLDLCGTDYDDITEYQLLVRCLSEQTIVEEGFRRLRTKEDGGFHSGILQNPSDPDATYRSKAGKNIRAMWQILKKPLIEMVLLSQITSLSKTFTVTAVF